MLRVKPD
jgi:chromosome segregation ATPase